MQRAHGQGGHLTFFLNRLVKLLGFSEFSVVLRMNEINKYKIPSNV